MHLIKMEIKKAIEENKKWPLFSLLHLYNISVQSVFSGCLAPLQIRYQIWKRFKIKISINAYSYIARFRPSRDRWWDRIRHSTHTTIFEKKPYPIQTNKINTYLNKLNVYQTNNIRYSLNKTYTKQFTYRTTYMVIIWLIFWHALWIHVHNKKFENTELRRLFVWQELFLCTVQKAF